MPTTIMLQEDQPPSELEEGENNSLTSVEEQSHQFHILMEEALSTKDGTAYPMSIPLYNKRIEFSRKIRQGVPVYKLKKENPQTYDWANKYDILTLGDSEIFVFREKTQPAG